MVNGVRKLLSQPEHMHADADTTHTEQLLTDLPIPRRLKSIELAAGHVWRAVCAARASQMGSIEHPAETAIE